MKVIEERAPRGRRSRTQPFQELAAMVIESGAEQITDHSGIELSGGVFRQTIGRGRVQHDGAIIHPRLKPETFLRILERCWHRTLRITWIEGVVAI
ncbi:MAG: hypothetical protein ACPGPE_13085, partial [Planctomycetota bacterium]